jgi:hypothetical protein
MPEDLMVQITTGRAVDAQGNIHLEGKGVVPTVKVPVTAETLQKQANGEDVVLAAAEQVISQPKGAGIVPSGAPKMADKAGAQAALSSAKQLEGKAKEQYTVADFGKPGTLTYTIVLSSPETLVWLYPWCAKTSEILKQNFENIQLKFVLDGKEVPLADMVTTDLENGGQQCRLYFAALSDWPAGEHHLSTTATFASKINDGTADYEPGDYVLDYTVYMNP